MLPAMINTIKVLKINEVVFMALDLEVLCLNDDSKIGGNRASTALPGAVGRFVQVSGYIGGLTGHAPGGIQFDHPLI